MEYYGRSALKEFDDVHKEIREKFLGLNTRVVAYLDAGDSDGNYLERVGRLKNRLMDFILYDDRNFSYDYVYKEDFGDFEYEGTYKMSAKDRRIYDLFFFFEFIRYDRVKTFQDIIDDAYELAKLVNSYGSYEELCYYELAKKFDKGEEAFKEYAIELDCGATTILESLNRNYMLLTEEAHTIVGELTEEEKAKIRATFDKHMKSKEKAADKIWNKYAEGALERYKDFSAIDIGIHDNSIWTGKAPYEDDEYYLNDSDSVDTVNAKTVKVERIVFGKDGLSYDYSKEEYKTILEEDNIRSSRWLKKFDDTQRSMIRESIKELREWAFATDMSGFTNRVKDTVITFLVYNGRSYLNDSYALAENKRKLMAVSKGIRRK